MTVKHRRVRTRDGFDVFNDGQLTEQHVETALGEDVNYPEGGTTTDWVTVEIPHSQLITMRATPVTLLPAAGVGTILLPQFMLIFQDTAAGAYGVGAIEFLKLKYKDATGFNMLNIQTDSFLNSAIKQVVMVGSGVTNGPVGTSPGAENKALVLHHDGAAELTGGNAANKLTIGLAYRILQVPTGW